MVLVVYTLTGNEEKNIFMKSHKHVVVDESMRCMRIACSAGFAKIGQKKLTGAR
jgi:hypothetical protein